MYLWTTKLTLHFWHLCTTKPTCTAAMPSRLMDSDGEKGSIGLPHYHLIHSSSIIHISISQSHETKVLAQQGTVTNGPSSDLLRKNRTISNESKRRRKHILAKNQSILVAHPPSTRSSKWPRLFHLYSFLHDPGCWKTLSELPGLHQYPVA